MLTIAQCTAALARCKKLSNRLSEKPAGCEAIFRDALVEVCAEKYSDVRREVPLKDIGATRVWDRRPASPSNRTKVDIYIPSKAYAAEIKVVQLPRLKRTAVNDALWDLGQVTADYWTLSTASQLEAAHCVILLHGALVGNGFSRPFVERTFHNQMYLDFQMSTLWGQLKREGREVRRRKQISVVQHLGWDHPYARDESTGQIRVSEPISGMRCLIINVERIVA